MEVQQIQLSDLKPADYNPRIITKDEFEGLKHSLKTFKQTENLVVNKDMTIISGHQRREAMLQLGWTTAACLVLDVDKKTEKKLNLEMNNQAISGGWDSVKVAEMLELFKTDDDYEALRLQKLEPLDLSGINYTSLEDGEATKQEQQYEMGGGIKQYTIVFDNSEQQERFMDWLKGLKAAYPEGETIAERIILALV